MGDAKVKNSKYKKLLGVKVDIRLTHNEHLNKIISNISLCLFLFVCLEIDTWMLIASLDLS